MVDINTFQILYHWHAAMNLVLQFNYLHYLDVYMHKELLY